MSPRIELSPLADFVAATVIRSTPAERVNHLPDGRTRLMFRLLPGGQADLHVVGPRRRAMYKRTTPCTAFIMVAFQPGGGYPFFGVPLAERESAAGQRCGAQPEECHRCAFFRKNSEPTISVSPCLA